ncbi:MAG: RNA-directed DNA polymerase [Actinobacteria bacterium]|nr:RNA-directed DNA polymerase [Actinomycetota bacterium]
MEAINKVNFKKAFRRLKKSTKGFSKLIVRDPLDYIDFEIELENNINNIIYEIISNKYKPDFPYEHLSAKNKGINRPTVILDIKDALIYRFLIEQIEDELIKKTRQIKNIRGGIKITANENPNNDDDYYEKSFKIWKEHQDNLRESLKRKKYLVTTDIASYFENINILVLKDAIRSDIEGKKTVVNLLFYLLENIHTRYKYEVNNYTGLPQEDIDCSRTLAYYFLHPHDEDMAEFCKKEDAEYYRFVDDMSITVNNEVTGRKALKKITESLRKLNLVSSIEKTSIIKSSQAEKELFFEENDQLTLLEKNIIEKLKEDKNIDNEISEIQYYYKTLKKNKKDAYKNWIKILKRFYTISSYVKTDFLMQEFHNQIIEYPILFSDIKIGKYLLRIRNCSNFNNIIKKIVEYLYSDENLYPAVESNLIEAILLIPTECFDNIIKEKIIGLGNDILFRKNKYLPLSNYSRALSCLLVYKFNNSNIDNVAQHYINSKEDDFLVRKYLFFVSLTASNSNICQKVLNKAKKDHDCSVQRLVNLVENICTYKDTKFLKMYLKNDEIYIYYNEDEKYEIKEKYYNIRSVILKKLVAIYH